MIIIRYFGGLCELGLALGFFLSHIPAMPTGPVVSHHVNISSYYLATAAPP